MTTVLIFNCLTLALWNSRRPGSLKSFSYKETVDTGRLFIPERVLKGSWVLNLPSYPLSSDTPQS